MGCLVSEWAQRVNMGSLCGQPWFSIVTDMGCLVSEWAQMVNMGSLCGQPWFSIVTEMGCLVSDWAQRVNMGSHYFLLSLRWGSDWRLIYDSRQGKPLWAAMVFYCH